MWPIALLAAGGALALASNRGPKNLVQVRSHKDGNLYNVQNLPDKQEAADRMADIKSNLDKLIEHYKNDPTLPTFRNIVCPNEECATRTSGVQPNIKGIKLDAVNGMWMYQCTVCNETWKQLARG